MGAPVVGIVGQSGSGKTLLLERLIPEVKKRGWRVGAIKHTHHAFDYDPQGKDSARLFQSGAHVVAFASSAEVVVRKRIDSPVSPDELVSALMDGVDLVLVEGYRALPIPKIEVLGRGEKPTCPSAELLAVVAEDVASTVAPCFRPAEAARLAELLEARFLTRPRQEA
jgi:molybdopterin-guanine dinucleotide biosynthesis protein MobB